MQRVLLMRHGIAEDAGPGQRDSERALTDPGRRRVEAVATDLAATVGPVDRMVSSDYLRAIQTADILARHLQPGQREISTGLVPHGDPASVYDWLGALPDAPVTVLVGHEPQMNLLLGVGLTGTPWGPARFGKASVAMLAFQGGISAGRGQLELFLRAGLGVRSRE
ncbi:SixA phosphatase family protein [Aquisalimonas asiatica]|uniref:Phosphohistidine phosphatase, SixA n=1 Tax=Aquisalimonas asiatica TaxID=406100 RepID=A0A1H8QAB4_9GAMM|nr:histidine phosphatase family protein [Aquisalimonas asiatica]SEO50941.1 phosphohistidine phosphatase, SixA [Aquisalimonas asiatica]